MTLKYVYTFAFLAITGVASAQIFDVKSQETPNNKGDKSDYRATSISIITKSKDTKKYDFKRLYGEEALAFDLATYLKENGRNEVIKITKTEAKNKEINIVKFDKKNWDGSCFNFEQNIQKVEKKPLLGVASRPVEEGKMGLGVSRVIPNSGAENAGIIESDVIMSVEGETVYTNCDLTQAIGSYDPNDALDIDVVRDGRTITVPTVLGYKVQTTSDWVAVCTEETNSSMNISVNKPQLGTLEVFPNPTSGVAQVSYQSKEQGELTFILKDVTGRELYSLTEENFSGDFRQSVDLTGKAVGMYFIHIIHNGQVNIEKLVVQHKK